MSCGCDVGIGSARRTSERICPVPDHPTGGGLPLERLLDLALPLAEALQYAHRKGVVHRDLKPANVMISELGIPKILDFGLAKVILKAEEASEVSTAGKLTDAGVVLGTVAYMSPEQALGKKVDWRSDVFSFGSLLYEMASGKPAFSGKRPRRFSTGSFRGSRLPWRGFGRMYFENLADRADSDNLARMLSSLLITELSGSEGLDVVRGSSV